MNLNGRKPVVFIFGNHTSEFAAEAEIAVLCFEHTRFVVTAGFKEQINLGFKDKWRKAEPTPKRVVVDFSPYPTYAAPAFISIHMV